MFGEITCLILLRGPKGIGIKPYICVLVLTEKEPVVLDANLFSSIF